MDAEALQLIIDMVRRDVEREYEWADIWCKQSGREDGDHSVSVIYNEGEAQFKLSHATKNGNGPFGNWESVTVEFWLDRSDSALGNAADRAQAYWIEHCEKVEA